MSPSTTNDNEVKDDWETQDVDIDLSLARQAPIRKEEEVVGRRHGQDTQDTTADDGGDDYWDDDDAAEATKKDDDEIPLSDNHSDDDDHSNSGDGEPMFLIDVTKINPNIHSKHDKNSVNDPEAASTLRRSIESQFFKYSNNSKLIADGTVIPCSTSVWKDALSRMRNERKGHYFLPIFPPKKG